MNLTPKTGRLSLVVRKRSSTDDHRLSLAELEPLPRAFLSILLALFGARITSHHAFGLELRAQLSVKQHESARDAEADCIRLASDSAAAHICQDVERARSVGRDQRPLSRDALRRRHKIFIERLAINLELAAAGT